VLHAIVALDHDRFAVRLSAPVPVGAVVQFHVVDPAVAGEGLLASLADVEPPTRAALLFAGVERAAMRDDADADVRDVSETLDTTAVAGMACVGELGPAGSSNAGHTGSVSALLFR
jgi:small ligand-binding sensory domain FIST